MVKSKLRVAEKQRLISEHSAVDSYEPTSNHSLNIQIDNAYNDYNDEYPIPIVETSSKGSELAGMLYMILAALAFSIMSLLVHILSKQYPSSEIIFSRAIIQAGFAALHLCIIRKNLFGPTNGQVRLWIIIRGLFGSLNLALFFYALSLLSIADASVIFFTAPVFAGIFAYFLVGEPMGKIEILSSVTCIAGLVLVIHPDFLFGNSGNDGNNDDGGGEGGEGAMKAYEETIGYIVASGAALAAGFAYASVRKIRLLSDEVNAMVLVFYFGMITSLLSPILFVFEQPIMPDNWLDIAQFLGVGIFAFLSQIWLNRSLQLVPAGPVMQLKNLDIVFAFLYDIFIFHKQFLWTSYMGALLIILSTGAIGLSRWLKSSNTI